MVTLGKIRRRKTKKVIILKVKRFIISLLTFLFIIPLSYHLKHSKYTLKWYS